MVKLTFLTVIIVDAVEEIRVEVLPFFKSILLTEHTRIDVECYESGLNDYCARSAERIYKIALSVPSAQKDESCSKHLIDWSGHSSCLIAALMEAFA